MMVLLCIVGMIMMAGIAYCVMTAEPDPYDEIEGQEKLRRMAENQKVEDMKTYQVKLYEGKDGWRWRIMAGNGKILAHSEAYDSRGNALKAAKRVVSTPLVFVEDDNP